MAILTFQGLPKLIQIDAFEFDEDIYIVDDPKPIHSEFCIARGFGDRPWYLSLLGACSQGETTRTLLCTRVGNAVPP